MTSDSGAAAAAGIDAVTLEVIGNRLHWIVEEMGEALIRAAYSSNMKERRDISTALFDASGVLIAQAEHVPFQLGALLGIVEAILERHDSGAFEPGDMFVCNDPYTGGATHLPDIAVAAPVFADGRLIGFVANVGHHADFVQRAHGNIFQEGIRIPPVRVLRGGHLIAEVMTMILANCQLPAERAGDFRAQFAANHLGARRLIELCAKYGLDTVLATARTWLDYTEAKTREGIRSIPPGRYRFNDRLDNFELPEPIELSVEVEVGDGSLAIRFDAPPQLDTPLNMVTSALRGCVYYAVKTIAAPSALANAGLFRPILIEAPRASMLNAVAPAPVMSRAQTGQRVVDLIYGALAPAIPRRIAAAHNGAVTAIYLSGHDPRSGRFYSHVETYGGGFGARAEKDGIDGIQANITNTSNLPIESFEIDYPFRVERYELERDSGGAGRTRGGLGLRREMTALGHASRYRIHDTRRCERPWGLFGGAPGASSRFEIRNADGSVSTVSQATGTLTPEATIVIVTPGAGGYGQSSQRDRELIKRDLLEDRVSPDALRTSYGLSLADVRTLVEEVERMRSL